MLEEDAVAPDQTVRLDLTLVGGHRVRASVHESSPVIDQLLRAYSAGSAGSRPTTFGLSTPDEQGTVFVRSSDILTIEVDRIVQSIASPADERFAGTYVVLGGFLLKETRDALLDYVLVRQPDFKPSTITDDHTGDNTVRSAQRVSETLYDFPSFRHVLMEKLHAALPSVLTSLDMKPFPISRMECQITAYRNGAFFKRHADDSGGSNTRRRISYVYYFNAEPKSFSGGELNLYPQGAAPVVVAPTNNAIVFFRSALEHDVSPVLCPGSSFSHSRFTVNGWIHD